MRGPTDGLGVGWAGQTELREAARAVVVGLALLASCTVVRIEVKPSVADAVRHVV